MSHGTKNVRRSTRPIGRAGFTLLELMIVMVVLTVLTGALTALAIALNEAAMMQEANITSLEDARRGMNGLTQELRQARAASIVINDATPPGDVIQYQVPLDLDGNGNALDANGNVEMSPVRTIMLDVNDLNNDGLTTTQLIMTETGSGTPGGPGVFVVTNGLFNEDRNGNGVLDPNEDRNNNGVLDTGLDISFVNGIMQIILTTGRAGKVAAGPSGQRLETLFITTLSETIAPRN